jgi:hypothetical protein
MKSAIYLWALAALAIAVMALGIQASVPANFQPDSTFKGSALTGWHVVGDADWNAQNGELIGKAKPGGSGGWIVMDKNFQDVQIFANYRCIGTCSSGVLLRAQKTPDGGMHGVYTSLTAGELGSYAVTLDPQGKEVAREQLTAPARGGGGGGRAGAPPVAAGKAGFGGGRGTPTLKTDDWNPVNLMLTASTFRSTFGGVTPVDEKDQSGFGPFALYVGGSGEVHYKDVAWKDQLSLVVPKEELSPRFTTLRLNPLNYGLGATIGDINRDGNPDVISGPFYFLGPGFTERRIYREGRVYNPTNEFAPDMVNLAADFTGDGWPDILSSLANRHMDLYVNPHGESRRWDKYSVLTTISTEIVLMRDLDKDGKPEIIFGQNGQAPGGAGYAWAHPDPANPTAVWTPHIISSPGDAMNNHGIGVGDINSDGRLDIVVPSGWYEQPAEGIAKTPWAFHPYAFGDGTAAGVGTGDFGVYDINGDGLTDVIIGSPHNWGLYWYEQKRSPDGSRTFVQHPVMQDFSTENAGNVVFSELHSARVADMNGDGIPDFITGKRVFSENENATGNSNTTNPLGPAVLYIFKTVRDPKAPGGARFEPELVSNQSGVGTAFDVADLNKDGAPDIVTSTVYGTFVYLSRPATTPRKK